MNGSKLGGAKAFLWAPETVRGGGRSPSLIPELTGPRFYFTGL